ncbi:MAG: hypothetical protein EXQ70_11925 [Solirubrobacterales bacterium]|nr:hypothetical protein [Solirubrobacterales bacterium]
MGLKRKLALTAGIAAVAVAMFGGTAPSAQAAGSACPTFRVLHNDRIGPAVLPKGTYNIKLTNPGLSCAGATHNFTIFLQDYDGKLGGGWKVVAQGTGKAAFRYKRTIYFRVALIGGGGGGGGSTGNPCPGSFHVLHNDRIGPIAFPKGFYKLVIPAPSIVTCSSAAGLFKKFLNIPSGKLPKDWAVKASSALFYKRANPPQKKFRVDPAT